MGEKAARITDRCKHQVTVVTTGSPDTTVGSLLAARLGDLTTPCPLPSCLPKPPPPGRIVQGSMTVFINSLPAARVTDLVLCCVGVPPPPPGGFHMPCTEYSVKAEDNYVDAVFTDESFLIKETPGTPDKQPEKKPLSRFLQGLSLDINLGSRFGLTIMAVGLNVIDSGCSTVFIGG